MMNSLGFNDQRLGREGFAKANGNTTMKYQNGGMLVVNKEDTYAAAERCAAAPAPRAPAAAAGRRARALATAAAALAGAGRGARPAAAAGRPAVDALLLLLLRQLCARRASAPAAAASASASCCWLPRARRSLTPHHTRPQLEGAAGGRGGAAARLHAPPLPDHRLGRRAYAGQGPRRAGDHADLGHSLRAPLPSPARPHCLTQSHGQNPGLRSV